MKTHESIGSGKTIQDCIRQIERAIMKPRPKEMAGIPVVYERSEWAWKYEKGILKRFKREG